MASDLINLAASAGVALLVGNVLHHRKRAAEAEETNARAHEALTQIDQRLGKLADRKGTPSADASPGGASKPAAASAPKPADSTKPTAPARTHASPRPLVRAYDGMFAELGRDLPVPYLRALAHGESGLRIAARHGDARGLFQIVPIVLRDYNRRHETTYEPGDLYKPEINIAVAAGALRTIIASFRTRHADVPHLQEDWTDPRFVELLTFSWAAGWSEAAGVGRVVSYMVDKLGMSSNITIDSVARWAKHAGASKHLSNPRKVRYAKAVARRYFVERDHDAAEGGR